MELNELRGNVLSQREVEYNVSVFKSDDVLGVNLDVHAKDECFLNAFMDMNFCST